MGDAVCPVLFREEMTVQENAYGTRIQLTAMLFAPDDSDLISVHGADPQDAAAGLEAMSHEFHAW